MVERVKILFLRPSPQTNGSMVTSTEKPVGVNARVKNSSFSQRREKGTNLGEENERDQNT